MLEHIDSSLSNEIENDDKEYANIKCHKTNPYNIMDEFDANGRPLHESDTESDTEFDTESNE